MIPTWISKAKAVAIIAERTIQPRENLRSWKNKINGQLNTRIKKGAIKKNEKGQLLSGTVASSMDKIAAKFPECFHDWPWCVIGDAILTLEQRVIEGKKIELPDTVTQCHAVIKALHEEIDRLKPDAERYRQICAKNKENPIKNKERKDF